MNHSEKATKAFKEGYNCSQAVLSAFAEELNLDKDLALKVSCGFGGGMARMSETCGAVTGALMTIGLKYGKTVITDNEARDKTYSKVNEFVEEFKSMNNTIVCKELLGCVLSTPEGAKMASEKNFHTTICPKFVADAAEILEKIL
jgi:C_GCAxxG_C_C family probable redox protein